MKLDLSEHITEYISSQYFTIFSGPSKNHAEIILHGYSYHIAELCDAKLKLEHHEKVLHQLMSKMSFPIEVKKDIPELLSSYLAFVSETGRNPEASLWLEDIKVITPAYLGLFREDGSVKGKTFKKNYTDVGRNDQCPCGSGLKFKKCCLKLLEN